MLPLIIVAVVPPDKTPIVGEVDEPEKDVGCNVVKTVNVFKDIDEVDDVDEARVDVNVGNEEGVLEVAATNVIVELVVGNADVVAVEDGEAVVLSILDGSSEKKIGVGSPESLNADPLAGEQPQRPAS